MNLMPDISKLPTAISRSIGFLPDPAAVTEREWEDYLGIKRIQQDKHSFICEIPEDNNSDKNLVYEVMLYYLLKDDITCFSMLRTKELEPAKDYMDTLIKLLIPILEISDKATFTESMLQQFTITLKVHPSWNVIHLAAHFHCIEILNGNAIEDINEAAEGDGKTPLHIATQAASLIFINRLLEMNADVNTLDLDGNSPIHYAAEQDISILETFRNKIDHRVIHLMNYKSESPITMALKRYRPMNARYLLRHRLAITKEKAEDKFDEAMAFLESLNYHALAGDYGGNLLHRVRTKTAVLYLVDLGFDIDELNVKLQTPLHVMVLEDKVECAMTLLGLNCNPDVKDEKGNTPLHYAVHNLNFSMCIALLVFGANPNILNAEEASARHVASTMNAEDEQRKSQDFIIYILHFLGATRCIEELAECQEGCHKNGQYNGNTPESIHLERRGRWLFDTKLRDFQNEQSIKYQNEKYPRRKGTGRVLCLDGGGVKGLCSTQIIFVIEAMMGAPIYEYFDFISGTSIGGILALTIANGGNSKQAQHMLCSLKDKIFVGMKPFKIEKLTALLKDLYGEHKKMKEIKNKKVVLHATAADRIPAELHRFRNYQSPISISGVKEHKDFMPTPTSESYMWEAALSTAACPGYFRPYNSYLDGAFFSNNPVVDTLTEIEELNTALKMNGREDEVFNPTVVVSIGCSQEPISMLESVDIASKNFISATRNVMNITIDNLSATEGPVVDRGRAWCASRNIPYFRFNPVVSKCPDLVEKDAEILLHLMWETRSYMLTQTKQLQDLKKLLLPPAGNIISRFF